MNNICVYCKAKILWFPLAPDGRKIPVNAEPDRLGALKLDSNINWLVKVVEGSGDNRYRSHLLDCKPMAKALAAKRTITLGRDVECEYENCSIIGTHFHCFKCGEAGHFANACENEEADETKPLVFDA